MVRLAVVFPRHVQRFALVVAFFGLETVAEVAVGAHGGPGGHARAHFGNLHAVVDRRIGRTRVGLADAGHVGGIGETALRVGVLNLHDGFGSVLVAEEDVLGVVVLRQGAVDGLDLLQRFEGSVPLLVPHGHFGDEHVGAGARLCSRWCRVARVSVGHRSRRQGLARRRSCGVGPARFPGPRSVTGARNGVCLRACR